MSFHINIQYKLKTLCRATQVCSTVALAIFIVFVYFTKDSVRSRTACSSNVFVTREGCLPCPRGTFSFPGWSTCRPWLNCSEIALEVHQTRLIGDGYNKLIQLANWKGHKVVFIDCNLSPGIKKLKCARGISIMEEIQGKFVTRLVGRCPRKLQAVAMFYKHGSANNLDELLHQRNLSQYNNIQTRLQLSVDYVTIMAFLHNSPTGVRIICDTRSLSQLLSQYLITDDFHMVVNDLDQLSLVTKDGACRKNRQVSGPLERELQRRGRPNETEPPKFSWAGTNDEKSDIWKLPWVVRKLLSNVKGSNFVKAQLSEIMERCNAIDPQLRPTANEVLQELLRVQKVIRAVFN